MKKLLKNLYDLVDFKHFNVSQNHQYIAPRAVICHLLTSSNWKSETSPTLPPTDGGLAVHVQSGFKQNLPCVINLPFHFLTV